MQQTHGVLGRSVRWLVSGGAVGVLAAAAATQVVCPPVQVQELEPPEVEGLPPLWAFGGALARDGDALVAAAYAEWLGPPALVYLETDDAGAWHVEQVMETDAVSDVTMMPFPSLDFVGDRVVLGMPYCCQHGTGVAHVFERAPGEPWQMVATLAAADGDPGDAFGTAVAIGGDTVFVSAPRGDNGTNTGAVHLFREVDGRWTQVDTIIGPVASDTTWFGQSISLHDDLLAVGSASVSAAEVEHVGAVHLFERDDAGAWVHIATVTSEDAAIGDGFGRRVAVHGDTMMVGAPHAESGQGAAYVFTRMGDEWVQTSKLTSPADPAGTWFGLGLALTDELAAIGAPLHPIPGEHTAGGAAYVYVRDDAGEWTMTSEIINPSPPPSGTSAFFGLHLIVGDDQLIGSAPSANDGFGFLRVLDIACADGDVNADGMVDVADLLELLAAWGACKDVQMCPADLDDDATVGTADLLMLLRSWS